ncbi:hypothetical protein [Mycobacteroides abscessus]|uniref:hypothetical protein n=1 Tax=Mycobacteroides abscessus TaxID=36809 RepID=UPI0009277879|nr:hypothetical protein [Mycobacteroides abscessus]SIN36412.1 Uncharacterised protein [Mycobacteroides abscessus subsp. abscessus]
MNTKKYLVPIALATLTLTACGATSGEATAPPSSPASASPSTTTPTSAADAAAAAGLPDTGSVVVAEAEAARRAGRPYVFGTGRGCAWLRLSPDGGLYALHENGSGSARLVRDRGTEAAFRADPTYEPGACRAATDIPTADDATQPEPYRWIGAFDTTFLRWGGHVFIVPGTVQVGLALRPSSN